MRLAVQKYEKSVILKLDSCGQHRHDQTTKTEVAISQNIPYNAASFCTTF